jgi:dTMP kinase
MTRRFITFEGGEGSGKTTQVKLLHDYLVSKGIKCVATREPGGSPSGDAIRQLVLTGSSDKWHSVSETLLFMAARVEHVERVIRPALADGAAVLCDRFLDSTIVYQGVGKGLSADYIRQLHRLTLGNCLPGLTLLLDINPVEGLKRAKKRAGDETRFESMDLRFHRDVREGFLALAHAEPERCRVIDAGRSVEEVQNAICKTLDEVL